MVDGEQTNAASEWWRAANRFLNGRKSPPDDVRSSLTDDFTYSDRSGGSIFPDLDAEGFARFVGAGWAAGAGQPVNTVREVVAVRGERVAAVTAYYDYGNGMGREILTVVGLDPSLRRLHRVIDFDADDLDAAIAELDRLHSESDGH